MSTAPTAAEPTGAVNRVLGLDLSLTAPGIALVRPPEEPLGAVVKVGKAMGAERLAVIGHAVRQAVWDYHPDVVAIEGYSYNSELHAHGIGELGGVIRYLLHIGQMAYIVIPPAQWRKQLFGRNLRKDQVAVEALKRYGVEWPELDVLEAWCVATAAWRLRAGLDKPPLVKRRPQRPGAQRVRSVAT